MGLSIFFKGSWKDFVAFCKSHALYRAPSHAFSKPAGPGGRTHFLNIETKQPQTERGGEAHAFSLFILHRGKRLPQPAAVFFPFFESSFFLLTGKAIIFDWQNYVYYSGTAGALFPVFPGIRPFFGKSAFYESCPKITNCNLLMAKGLFLVAFVTSYKKKKGIKLFNLYLTNRLHRAIIKSSQNVHTFQR